MDGFSTDLKVNTQPVVSGKTFQAMGRGRIKTLPVIQGKQGGHCGWSVGREGG